MWYLLYLIPLLHVPECHFSTTTTNWCNMYIFLHMLKFVIYLSDIYHLSMCSRYHRCLTLGSTRLYTILIITGACFTHIFSWYDSTRYNTSWKHWYKWYCSTLILKLIISLSLRHITHTTSECELSSDNYFIDSESKVIDVNISPGFYISIQVPASVILTYSSSPKNWNCTQSYLICGYIQ